MERDNRQYSQSSSGYSIAAYVVAAITGFIALTIIGGSWYTIGQYERGILLRNGAFVSILQPGLGWKWPFIDTVIHVDMRDETQQFKGMEAYSHDQQPAHLLVSVTFVPDESKLRTLYGQYQTRDAAEITIITPAVMKNTKIVFGQYTATQAIQSRSKLNIDIENAVKVALDGSVFLIKSVQLEDVSFGKEYMSAIDARMQAEVEVLKFRQTLEKEKVLADIKRAQAQGNADAVKTKADADAYAIEKNGAAEAKAIDLKGKALSNNPNYIGMVQAERWDGKLPQTMIPGGSLPMINLERK